MALHPDWRSAMVLPAVCAPMMAVSGPELVGAACKAGIMAGLPRHNARTSEEFAGWLDDLRRDFDAHAAAHPGAPIGPLAVNLINSRPLDELIADLDLCVARGVRLFITAMGNPTDLTKAIHDRGGIVFHDVTSLRFAEKAISASVDGLVCIGSGGGGHSGTLNALAFLPRVRAMWDGTIVFAGSVSNGAAIRAAEILGADLAYLGTRFIATQEARADAAYKAMLVEGGLADLLYTDRVTGVNANWLIPSLTRHGLDPADLPASPGHRRHDHLPEGVRPWRELWSAGQGIETITDIPDVAELVARLRRDYVAACTIPDWREAAA
ncbi:nitronate monooxygenase [Sphingomonas sp. CGMCC 1.13654]|uniref:Nitronate monooxygenase n=1 Tax=Sphingomonas chungangi TaxID=2683589 RepID=A0A838L2X5_9SPHN|nr:nitronate monooxygenase [Sphingomonas chungangi]MBA2933741.1 nitronate monooxygenase [Sphingomonas chungangi]MVW55072.1 nitronate monooxygenase [Sphingomonas chungangi]